LKPTGAPIDSGDVKKHKKDMFRLYAILNPQDRYTLADLIKTDLQAAFQLILQDTAIDLKVLGIKGKTVDDIIGELESVYKLK
jgi:thiamine pyrophosphokinase